MTEIESIVDQMDRAFAGDAWHGPPLKSLLDGLLAEDALKHPIDGAHSIWELVLHLTAWNGIMRHELLGERAEITTETDWPAIWDTSEVAWKRTLDSLTESHKRLRDAAATLRDDQLAEIPVERTANTRYVMLHGVVQHNLYHAGQIALLRRAIAGARKAAGM
jgi:uncharacterized damage-inducible protein DinB